jgi:hypothetical protein
MFDVIAGKFNVTYSGCLIVKTMHIITNRGDYRRGFGLNDGIY